MIKRIIVGFSFQMINLFILLLYILSLLLTFIDSCRIKRKYLRKCKSITYRKLTEENSGHIPNEKRSFYYLFSTILLHIILQILYTIGFFIILYSLDDVHDSSWFEFFFDFKNKKTSKATLSWLHESIPFSAFFVFSLLSLLCNYVYISILLTFALIVSGYAVKVNEFIYIHFYEGIPLILILVILFCVALFNLFTGYIYSYLYCKSVEGYDMELSDKCNDLLMEHFDYIIYCPNYRSINCANGLIFHKSYIVFYGNIKVFTDDEVYAIILHEIGHGKNKGIHTDYFIRIFIELTIVSIFYFLCKLYVQEFFDGDNVLVLYFLICFAYLINNIYRIFDYIYNFTVEIKADNFAIDRGYGEQLITALQKINYQGGITCKMNRLTNYLFRTHPCNYFRALNFDRRTGKV